MRFPMRAAAVRVLLSLPIKELLFWSTRAVARRIKSDLVMANAWHHRANSLSTLGVALALAVFGWVARTGPSSTGW